MHKLVHNRTTILSKPENLNDLNIDRCNLLVDTGATTHIISDEKKLVRNVKNFDSSKHYIELADGSRKNNLVTAKGDAQFHISDDDGKPCTVLLKNAICVPSYNQDIFSVKRATEQGATVTFSPEKAVLSTSEGKSFDITTRGKLYYLDIVNSVSTCKTRSLQEWHRIFGHWRDIRFVALFFCYTFFA